ncbi:hypothetical protein KM043_009912 [Ampulex compressa]|nr:hypothetical protein KM043_009912 [Ampulex compressa]
MAYSYSVEEVPPDDVPCVEHDLLRAKMFLQKHSPESGDSLYDHLSEVLAKILAERPENVVDIFEEYSRKVKEERFKSPADHFRDIYVPPVQYENARKLIKLYQTEEGERERIEDEDEDDRGRKIPNLLDLLFYFEQTNVGLPRAEMLLLNLAIRKLMSEAAIENVRFWGKILGQAKNYYVVEAELQEEELHRRLEMEAEEEEKRREEADETEKTTDPAEIEVVYKATEKTVPLETKVEEGLELTFPPMPVNSWKPPQEIPSEKPGTGLNKKVYFVCNAPGLDEWVELPPVTPQQIVIARQIVRYCTGNLETPIHTFPPFPGVERNYLRAQIARISAATHVSPIGFFTLGGEAEEEEVGEEGDEGAEGVLSENVHYDPLPVKDLVDSSMSNWCHHTPYILKQGRVTWWTPGKDEDEIEEEMGEEEEEEDEAKAAESEKELGPPLLTPLSEDATLDSIIPWTTRQSSYIQPEFAVALVRSNIWPGAFAFATGKRFANLYIGWGHKYTVYNYSPPSMPAVQDQYGIGPEVMETKDPTFEEEEAHRIAHLPPPPTLPMEEEEEAEDEEDEEDDEDDDD